jgi:hypothetical protein
MEQANVPHACPACTGVADLGPASGGWSRRALLRLGLVAGVGAAAGSTIGGSSAFAGGVGAAEREVSPPGAALLHAQLPQQPNFPVPPIITRAQWGANEAIRKPGQTYNSLVEKIVVHHTVTPNNPSDPAAVVRGVYQWSVSGEYIDIAYHFLIDQYGHVYEGRWARDYPAGVPHTGENAEHQNVQGAATMDHNPRTIAVAMLGTFTYELPTAAAMSSLVGVLAWKCARWGIDPLGSTPYLNSTGGLEVFPDVVGHRSLYPTICPGDPIIARLATVRDQVDVRVRNGVFGYWIVGADGRTHTFGDVPDVGDPSRLGLRSVIQAITAHPSGLGYWALGTDGGVFTFGTARFFGSTGGIHLNQPVVGMAATPSGNGYWLVARDGGIFCFGDARFFGSTGGIHLNQPIVAMCVTPSGNGYWLVARDGGIFCFGDAAFLGSGPGRGLRVPAVAAAATTTGRGYALLAADGTVLAFGDAQSYGSALGAGPIVGFAGRLLPKG